MNTGAKFGLDIEASAGGWKLVYNGFEPKEESLREALCTLANGYFGTRGTVVEATESDIHYPGTYIAGLYNRLATNIAGRLVVNEDLVNCPNWLFLTFRIEGEDWLLPSQAKLLDYRQELDMRQGVLIRRFRFEDSKGRITSVEVWMVVSMAEPHIGAIRYTVRPENYGAKLNFTTMLDGAVRNWGVKRYRQLKCQHWLPFLVGVFDRNGVMLSMRTTESKIQVVETARINVYTDSHEVKPELKTWMEDRKRIGLEFSIYAHPGESYTVEKIVSIYTSKDPGVSRPIEEAIEKVKGVGSFEDILNAHSAIWRSIWDKVNFEIIGDEFSQLAIRLHIFHVLQTVSPNIVDLDVGMPARGLHGEAYRGHVFWDTLYVIPFLNHYFPEISKALIMYRYRRLDTAREYAENSGYRGAMFPWQSGSSGKEETQVLHLNPLSGEWGPDYSRLQRHVSFAIAYNVWHYWKITDDWEFMSRYGAELLLSIAQFGSSLAKFDPKDGRYHTEGIMGPDEFHEMYPNSPTPGLRDNAYTNLMIVWTLLRALELLELMPKTAKKKLLRKLRITNRELERWRDITDKMALVIKNGLLEQFDGYFDLEELDWEYYRRKYGNIQRMDRILKAEGKSPDSYQVTKQADALMIFYLLPLEEVKGLFDRLGYDVGDIKEFLKENYDYYIKRTSHGSTLSKVVHCYLAYLLGKQDEAWEFYQDVLKSDIYDIQGGTTPEGIHMGVMGGSIDVLLRGFIGYEFSREHVKLNPMLPDMWQTIRFKLPYKGNYIPTEITREIIKIDLRGFSPEFELPLETQGTLYKLRGGEQWELKYR